jgi:hypothetical protein
MKRVFILAMLLASFTAAHGQTSSQVNTTGTGTIGAPCTTSRAATGIGCGPLSAPTASTLPSQGSSTVGTVTGGTSAPSTTTVTTATGQSGTSGAIGASAATNPENALQLPGEGLNRATQSANSTASAGAAGSPGGPASNTLCGTAMAGAAGALNPTDLFAGAAPGGC